MRNILIISLPFNNNYGYLLQNYALQKTIKDLFKEKQIENVLVQTDYRWNLQKNSPLKKLLLFFYRLFRLYVNKEYVYKNNLWNDNIQKTYLTPLLMKKQRVFVDKYLNMINFTEKWGGGKTFP
ncbi:MAG: hypothetical protein IJ180_07280 [Bacteroidales bacterium]|nr:hypothetical protein [Bacteroidales bacterium]